MNSVILPFNPQTSFKFYQLSQLSFPSCSIFPYRNMCYIQLSYLFRLFQQIFWLSFSFISLTGFKSIDLTFCRLTLSLGLSDISSWHELDHAFLSGINRSEASFFPADHTKRQSWSPGCVGAYQLSPFYILSIFPFVINEFFIERYSKIIYTSVSHSSSNLCMSTLALTDDVRLNQPPLWCL